MCLLLRACLTSGGRQAGPTASLLGPCPSVSSKCAPCRRALRKSSCCVVSSAHCFGLNILTLGFFTPCCLCPRILGATFKGKAR